MIGRRQFLFIFQGMVIFESAKLSNHGIGLTCKQNDAQDHVRENKTTESELADEEAGLLRRRGTRDQITNLRVLMQKMNEHQQPLYMFLSTSQKRLIT